MVCYLDAMVPVIWIADLYSNGGLNTGPLITWWSECWTLVIPGIWIVNHSKIEQISMIQISNYIVGYSDSHCIQISKVWYSDPPLYADNTNSSHSSWLVSRAPRLTAWSAASVARRIAPTTSSRPDQLTSPWPPSSCATSVAIGTSTSIRGSYKLPFESLLVPSCVSTYIWLLLGLSYTEVREGLKC